MWVGMDWHKELERSLTSQGEASLYDSAQYSASLLQVRPTIHSYTKVHSEHYTK